MKGQSSRVLNLQEKQKARQKSIANLQSKRTVIPQTTTKPTSLWRRLTGRKGGKSKKVKTKL